MDAIHIWEFPYNVSVDLSPNFISLVKSSLKAKYRSKPRAFRALSPPISFDFFRDLLKPHCRQFRDLSLFLLLCKDLNIPFSKLEENVVAYRTARGRVAVRNPILPVKVTPLFPMLLAHVFGDGNAVKIEGRETYFNYRQYDRTLTGLFIKKVEAVFGKLAYPHEYFFDLKRVYLPTIISLVIADYYGLSVADFLSDRARIPEQVFAVKSQMLAVLIAFIIDEGNVDSAQVAIRLKNPGLIIDLKRICGELGYACTVSKEDSEMPCLLILADGVKKLWADLSALKKEHPEVGMGHKEEAVKRFILRAKKEWRTASEGSAKNLIISILRDGPMRVRDLTRLVSMSRQGMRHHLTQLVSQGILQRKHLGGKKGYAYSLIRYVRLPVRRKGKSRQHGVTKQRVLSLLKERELTLKELNDVVCIDLNTLRNFLYRLEQDGLVERNGKRILTRRPWVVWKAR